MALNDYVAPNDAPEVKGVNVNKSMKKTETAESQHDLQKRSAVTQYKVDHEAEVDRKRKHAPVVAEQTSKTKRKRVDLHGRMESEAGVRPKQELGVKAFDDSHVEHAVKQYKIAVQRGRASSKATTSHAAPQSAKNHLRRVERKQVLVAGVEHDVMGNYEPQVRRQVVGPGEGGRPVHADVTSLREDDDVMRTHGFNVHVSDVIALNRTLRDTRHPQ